MAALKEEHRAVAKAGVAGVDGKAVAKDGQGMASQCATVTPGTRWSSTAAGRWAGGNVPCQKVVGHGSYMKLHEFSGWVWSKHFKLQIADKARDER